MKIEIKHLDCGTKVKLNYVPYCINCGKKYVKGRKREWEEIYFSSERNAFYCKRCIKILRTRTDHTLFLITEAELVEDEYKTLQGC